MCTRTVLRRAVLLVCGVSAPVFGQSDTARATTLVAGTPARLTLASGRIIVGALESASPGAVVLRSGARVDTISAAAVRSWQVQRSQWKKGAAVGGVLGAVGAIGFATAMSHGLCDTSECGIGAGGVIISGLAGAVPGAAVGAGIGLFIPRWATADAPFAVIPRAGALAARRMCRGPRHVALSAGQVVGGGIAGEVAVGLVCRSTTSIGLELGGTDLPNTKRSSSASSAAGVTTTYHGVKRAASRAGVVAERALVPGLRGLWSVALYRHHEQTIDQSSFTPADGLPPRFTFSSTDDNAIALGVGLGLSGGIRLTRRIALRADARGHARPGRGAEVVLTAGLESAP